MTTTIPAGSRRAEPFEYQCIDEDLHTCGHCGARTDLDEAGYYSTGALNHDCPHCGQRYVLEESDDEDAVSLDAEGEIEIVDETTGEVVGMTSAQDTPELTIWDRHKARLDAIREEDRGMPEASQADLDRLFGVKPSPYGDDFGSFG